MNAEADATPDMLRVSMDAKATVKMGPVARGGKGRVAVTAADHDFRPEATVTPVGLFLPQIDELFIYHVTSKVTSDCLVDRLEQWWDAQKARFAPITTLVLNLDNGPASHSHRTQFMGRLVAFVQRERVSVRLAYYPPYHSKYNPIERCWGILEGHWNGALLDSLEAVCGFTASMTWKGLHPVVELVTTAYATGVKLTKEAMGAVEAQVTRLPFGLTHAGLWLGLAGHGRVAAYLPNADDVHGTIALFDERAGALRASYAVPVSPAGADAARDRLYLDDAGTIRALRLRDGAPVASAPGTGPLALRSARGLLAFVRDAAVVLAAGGSLRPLARIPLRGVRALAFTPDGATLLVGRRNSLTRIDVGRCGAA